MAKKLEAKAKKKPASAGFLIVIENGIIER